MSCYEILDLKHSLAKSSDEESANKIIRTFAIDHFAKMMNDLHQDMMIMDLDDLKGTTDSLYGPFSFVASDEMNQLVREMFKASKEGDRQKLIDTYPIFLEKCLVFKKELEDYIKEKISGLDLEEHLAETKKKFVVGEMEGENKDNPVCAACNIF